MEQYLILISWKSRRINLICKLIRE